MSDCPSSKSHLSKQDTTKVTGQGATLRRRVTPPISARPFEAKHQFADVIVTTDRAATYPIATRRAAFKLESELIEHLKPLHKVRRQGMQWQ
jgi:hypothetical protein